MEEFSLEQEQNINIINFLIGLELIYPDNKTLKMIRMLLQVLSFDSKEDQNLYYLSELIQSLNETPDPFIKDLFYSIRTFPNIPWNDVLSRGQLLSKIWLIKELKKIEKNLGCVFVCAGWVGILPSLMLRDSDMNIEKIRSFDIDPNCAIVADSINKHPHVLNNWKFKASTCDILKIDYNNFQHITKRFDGSEVIITDSPDTIINTSCDHIGEFDRWWNRIPKNKLVILQNNDSTDLDDDHINTINSLEEMKKQAPMTTILFEGSLSLPKFNRYMLIGYK